MKVTQFRKTVTAITLGLLVLNTAALSEEEHHDSQEKHEVHAEHNAHEGHDWEFGFSVGYADLKTEDEKGGICIYTF